MGEGKSQLEEEEEKRLAESEIMAKELACVDDKALLNEGRKKEKERRKS